MPATAKGDKRASDDSQDANSMVPPSQFESSEVIRECQNDTTEINAVSIFAKHALIRQASSERNATLLPTGGSRRKFGERAAKNCRQTRRSSCSECSMPPAGRFPR